MARDKIKRAFTWIRKSLRIIDRTTLPGEILGEVRPTLDTFGWERLSETPQTDLSETANATATDGPIVPEGTMRYVLFASVQHDEPDGGNRICWIELVTSSFPVGILEHLTIAGDSTASTRVRYGSPRPLLMRPGELLRGRSTAATGVGRNLGLRQVFIDIPVGEYILPR